MKLKVPWMLRCSTRMRIAGRSIGAKEQGAGSREQGVKN